MTTLPDEFDQLTGVFDTRIAPSPAFAKRLRQRLHEEAESTHKPTRQPSPTLRVSAATPPENLTTFQGSPDRSRYRARRSLRPAWFGSLETAAAAILVIALVFGTIYGLQREQSTQDHGSGVMASPMANQGANGEVNWGGDAGHSWAFHQPAFASNSVSIKQGGESTSYANQMAAISNGKIVITHGPTDLSNLTQGYRINAFSLNETPRWTSALWIMPGMAIDSEHLYAIRILDSENNPGSANRQLIAISLENGEIAWTGPDIGTTGMTRFSWAPVVKNGVVFIADAKGSAYALKASNGSAIWESKIPADAIPNRADGSSVTQTGGVVAMNDAAIYVSGWVNTVRKLNPRTGKELATIQLPEGTQFYDLQLRGNRVVATGTFNDADKSSTSTLSAIDTATNNIRWTQVLPTRFDGNLVLLKDRVIVPRVDGGTSGPPISFDSYDIQTGKYVWIPAEALNLKNVTISAVDGPSPLLFISGSDGTLTVVNANSGDVIAEKPSPPLNDGSSLRQLPVFISGEALVFIQPGGVWFTITPGSK